MVTLPFSVREGINIFLAGFVPTENLRFREEALTFKVGSPPVRECAVGVLLPQLHISSLWRGLGLGKACRQEGRKDRGAWSAAA